MINECSLCLQEEATDGDMCRRCADWTRYWNGLSQEEQEQELMLMTRHASEGY